MLFAPASILAQSFEIYKGDTINRRDIANKRQGYWIFFYKTKTKKTEGLYNNNRREKVWVSYYRNGKRRAEITYTLGRKKGPAKTYYRNGKVAEEGVWDSNKWIKGYKAFHENGKLAYDWNYNSRGKRVGEQKYFHDNGKPMLQGNWNNGKIEGELTEFYSDGSLKAKRIFAAGKPNHKKTKFFEPPKLDVAKKDSAKMKYLPEGNNKDPETRTPVSSYFTGEGRHKLYKDSLLSREGVFREGQLYEGKHYYYDESGKLVKTVIYSRGKVTRVIKPDEK